MSGNNGKEAGLGKDIETLPIRQIETKMPDRRIPKKERLATKDQSGFLTSDPRSLADFDPQG